MGKENKTEIEICIPLWVDIQNGEKKITTTLLFKGEQNIIIM